jgi:hypothetical protein
MAQAVHVPRKIRLQYPGAIYPVANHPGKMRLESAEAKADRLIVEELARLGWTQDDLAADRKSDSSKLAMATRLRRETTLTGRRVAEKLQLGKPEGARANLHRWLKQSTAKSPHGVE